MTKIFIGGNGSFMSKGVNALTFQTMEILSKFVPDPEFRMLSIYPEVDYELYNKYGFNLKVSKRNESMIQSMFQLLQEYNKVDLIVDTNGGGFNDDDGSTIGSCTKVLMGAFIGKKGILFPQSFGPFNTKFTNFLAKFALNRTKLIMVRETISKTCLQEIGVKDSLIHLVPDIVFALQPISSEKVQKIMAKEKINKDDMPLIGINVSQLINHRSKNMRVENDYFELMSQIADYLVTELDATVLLIPHEIYPKEIKTVINATKEIGGDDISAINETFSKVKNKDKIIPIINEYKVDELKGIIRECNLFIGARLHANVAAISMHVPTISISYSHKYPGVMGMVGIENYICDYRTMTIDELVSKINEVWANREKIREELILNINRLKESEWLSGELVKELLEPSKTSSK